MDNKKQFHEGLSSVKEAVYNLLLEASETEIPELSNSEISERLEIPKSYYDKTDYPLIRGILDILMHENRVERVDSGRKMVWKIRDL